MANHRPDRESVRHWQGTQEQAHTLLVIKDTRMASKECPYRPEVKCCDGYYDHEPGDSEADYFHGNPLVVEIGLHVQFDRNSAYNAADSAR